MKFTCALAAATLALVSSPFTHAGDQAALTKNCVPLLRTPFEKGGKEFQLGLGAMTSVDNHGRARPRFSDVDLTLRFGRMLTTPEGAGFFRGNYEFLLDAGVGASVDGPGDVLGELAVLLRYNFVQPAAKFVPYAQLGGGAEFSNAYTDRVQRVLGSPVLFNLQAAFGCRYLHSDRCAFFVEADYRHASTGGFTDRNLGLNWIGGQFGVSIFY